MNTVSVLSDFRRIKLFFSNGIGDWILALPTMRAFVHTFGSDVGIVVGCDLPVELLVEFRETLVEIVVVSRKKGFRELSKSSFIGECDIFISLVPWYHHSVSRLANVAGAKITVGHFSPFSICLPPQEFEHSVDTTFRFFQLFRPNSLSDSFSDKPNLPASTGNVVGRIRNHLLGKALVAVHFDTAADKQPTFDLIDRFLTTIRIELDCAFLLIGGRSLIDRIPAADLEFLDSLDTCMRIVAEADFFVGADSCMLHVADLTRKAGVGIFVSTDPREFGFRFSEHAVSIDVASCDDWSQPLLDTVRRFKHAFIEGHFASKSH